MQICVCVGGMTLIVSSLLVDSRHQNMHDLFHGALLDALLRHKLNQLHEFQHDLWHRHINDLLRDSIRHQLLRNHFYHFDSLLLDLRCGNIHDFLSGAGLDALLKKTYIFRDWNNRAHRRYAPLSASESVPGERPGIPLGRFCTRSRRCTGTKAPKHEKAVPLLCVLAFAFTSLPVPS